MPQLYSVHVMKPRCNRFLVQCTRSYILSLDWTSSIRVADLCSISFSSCVNGCLTMRVTPFPPRTQGSDRNTSLSMPCWPYKSRKQIFHQRWEISHYQILSQLRLVSSLFWSHSHILNCLPIFLYIFDL